jgi:hypothetical protein
MHRTQVPREPRICNAVIALRVKSVTAITSDAVECFVSVEGATAYFIGLAFSDILFTKVLLLWNLGFSVGLPGFGQVKTLLGFFLRNRTGSTGNEDRRGNPSKLTGRCQVR